MAIGRVEPQLRSRRCRRKNGGGRTVVYEFDQDQRTFRALQLVPEADTLLLFSSDRVLHKSEGVRAAERQSYEVSQEDENPGRFTLTTHFLGQYR